MITLESTTEKLINRYTNDIIYDCHSTEVQISRSQARMRLQALGRESLIPIATVIESLFIVNLVNYDLYMAYIVLVCGIIKDHNLPESPYGSDVKYCDQDPKVWIEYCRLNG